MRKYRKYRHPLIEMEEADGVGRQGVGPEDSLSVPLTICTSSFCF